MSTPITANIIRGTTIESIIIHHWTSEDESLGVCVTVEVLEALEAETERPALAACLLKLETSDVEPLAEIIVSAAACAFVGVSHVIVVSNCMVVARLDDDDDETAQLFRTTCGRATLAVSATATTQLSDTGAVHTVPEETVTFDTTVAMADACEVGVGLWVGAIVGTLDGIAVG